jgi:hypothetical protein
MSPPPVSAVSTAGTAASSAPRGYSTWSGSLLGGTITATPSEKSANGKALWTVTVQRADGSSATTQIWLLKQFSSAQLTKGSVVKSALETQLSPPRGVSGAATAALSNAVKAQQRTTHPNHGSEHVSALKNALAGYASGGLSATDLRIAQDTAGAVLGDSKVPKALGIESRRYLEDFYRQAQAKLTTADARAQSKAQAQAQASRQAAEAGDAAVRKLSEAISAFDRGAGRDTLNTALAQARNADKRGWTAAQLKGFKAYDGQAGNRLWPKANPQLDPRERALALDGAAKAREQRGKKEAKEPPRVADVKIPVGAQAPNGQGLQGNLVRINERQWGLKGSTSLLYRVPEHIQDKQAAIAYVKRQIQTGGWGQLPSLDPRFLGGADEAQRGKQTAQYLKRLRQQIDIASQETRDGALNWAELANTRNNGQKVLDLVRQTFGDDSNGQALYERTQRELNRIYDQVVQRQINAGEGQRRMQALMARYRADNQKRIARFGDNPETSATVAKTTAQLSSTTGSWIVGGYVASKTGSPEIGAVAAGGFSAANRVLQNTLSYGVNKLAAHVGQTDQGPDKDLIAKANPLTRERLLQDATNVATDAVQVFTGLKAPKYLAPLGGKLVATAAPLVQPVATKLTPLVQPLVNKVTPVLTPLAQAAQQAVSKGATRLGVQALPSANELLSGSLTGAGVLPLIRWAGLAPSSVNAKVNESFQRSDLDKEQAKLQATHPKQRDAALQQTREQWGRAKTDWIARYRADFERQVQALGSRADLQRVQQARVEQYKRINDEAYVRFESGQRQALEAQRSNLEGRYQLRLGQLQDEWRALAKQTEKLIADEVSIAIRSTPSDMAIGGLGGMLVPSVIQKTGAPRGTLQIRPLPLAAEMALGGGQGALDTVNVSRVTGVSITAQDLATNVLSNMVTLPTTLKGSVQINRPASTANTVTAPDNNPVSGLQAGADAATPQPSSSSVLARSLDTRPSTTLSPTVFKASPSKPTIDTSGTALPVVAVDATPGKQQPTPQDAAAESPLAPLVDWPIARTAPQKLGPQLRQGQQAEQQRQQQLQQQIDSSSQIQQQPQAGQRHEQQVPDDVAVRLPRGAAQVHFGGMSLSARDLAALSGAPPGSAVEVSSAPAQNGTETLFIDVFADKLDGPAQISLWNPGQHQPVALSIDRLFVDTQFQRQGLPGRMLLQMASGSLRTGIGEIQVNAVGRGRLIPGTGSGADFGTYAYAKYGFNARLTDNDRAHMRQDAQQRGIDIDQVRDVQSLLKQKGGDQIWNDYRTPREMYFELGSVESVGTLLDYAQRSMETVPLPLLRHLQDLQMAQQQRQQRELQQQQSSPQARQAEQDHEPQGVTAMAQLEQEMRQMAQAPVAQLLTQRPALKQELLQLQRERGIQFEITSNNLKVFVPGATEAEKALVLDREHANFFEMITGPYMTRLEDQDAEIVSQMELDFKSAFEQVRRRLPALNREPAFLSDLAQLPEPYQAVYRAALSTNNVHALAKPLQDQGWSLLYQPAPHPALGAGTVGDRLVLRSPQGVQMPLLDAPSRRTLRQAAEPNGRDLVLLLERSFRPSVLASRLERIVGPLEGLSAILAHRQLPLSRAAELLPALGARLKQLEQDGWHMMLNPVDGPAGRLGGLFVRRPDGLRVQLASEPELKAHQYEVGTEDDGRTRQHLAQTYEKFFSPQSLEAALQAALGPLNGVDAILAEPRSMIGRALREYPEVEQRLRSLERHGWQVHQRPGSGLLTAPHGAAMPLLDAAKRGELRVLSERLLVGQVTLKQVADAVDDYSLRALGQSFGPWSGVNSIVEGAPNGPSAHPLSRLIAADRELLQTLRAAHAKGFAFLGDGDRVVLESPRSITILKPQLHQRVWRAYALTQIEGQSAPIRGPLSQRALQAELKLKMLGMLGEAGYALPLQALEKAQQQVASEVLAYEQQRQADAATTLRAIKDLRMMAGAGEEPAANRPFIEVLQGTDLVEGGRLTDEAMPNLLRVRAALAKKLGLQQGEVPLLTAALSVAAAHWSKSVAGDASKAGRATELKSQLAAALAALSPAPQAIALKDDTAIHPGQAYAIELDSLPDNSGQRFAPIATLLRAIRSTNPYRQGEGVYRVELSGPEAAPARLEITVDSGGWITVQQELASEWMPLASDRYFNQLSVVNGEQGLQRIEDIGYTRYAIAKDAWPSELLSRQRTPGSNQTTNPIDSIYGGADAIARALMPHLAVQSDLAAVSAALLARAQPVTLAQAQAIFLASTQSRGLAVGVTNDGQATLLAMTMAANNAVNTRPFAGHTAPDKVNSNKAFAAWIVFPSSATDNPRTDPLALTGPSLRDFWNDRKEALAHGDANDSPVEAQRVADRLGLGRLDPRTQAAEAVAATHWLSVAELEVLQLAIHKPQSSAAPRDLATQFVNAYAMLTSSEKPRPEETQDSRFAQADGLYAQATQSLLQKLGVDSIEAAVEMVVWPASRPEAAQTIMAQQRERDQQAQRAQLAGNIQSIAGGGDEPAANRPILDALKDTDLLHAGRLKNDAWPRLFNAQRAVAREFGVRLEDVSMHAAALKAAELFWTVRVGQNDSAFERARSAQVKLRTAVEALVRLAVKSASESQRSREDDVVAAVRPDEMAAAFLADVPLERRAQWDQQLTGGPALEVLLTQQARDGKPLTQDGVQALVSRNAPMVRPQQVAPGEVASITFDSAYELPYGSRKEMLQTMLMALNQLPDEAMQIRTPDGKHRFDLYRHENGGYTVIDLSTGDAVPVSSHYGVIRFVARSLRVMRGDSGALVVSYGSTPAILAAQPQFYMTRQQIEEMLAQPQARRPQMTAQTVQAITDLIQRGEITAAPGVWDAAQHMPVLSRQQQAERAQVAFEQLAYSFMLQQVGDDPPLAAQGTANPQATQRDSDVQERVRQARQLFRQFNRTALARLLDLDWARERQARIVAVADELSAARHPEAQHVRAMAAVALQRIQEAEQAMRLSSAPQTHAAVAAAGLTNRASPRSILIELARLLQGSPEQRDAADLVVAQLQAAAAALHSEPLSSDDSRWRADALAAVAREMQRQSQADRER